MSIADLAKTSLEIEDFCIRDFTIERAYLNASDHVTSGRLSIVHIDRPRCVEDDDNFADGRASNASGIINSTIYWLIGGTRCNIECDNEYHYSIHGHSGGMEDVNLHSTKIKFKSDSICRMTKSEFQVIRGCSMLASSTTYKDVVGIYEDVEAEIPRNFINAIVRECALSDSQYCIPDLKTYEEFLVDKEAEMVATALKAAEEARIRHEKIAAEKQRFVKLLKK